MPFVGTPIVKQISDSIVRISGVSMAAGTLATIGLHGIQGGAPDITLPASFQPRAYSYQGHDCDIPDVVECTVALVSLAGDDAPFGVGKTGTLVSNFRIELASPAASDSPGIEIYVKFHD